MKKIFLILFYLSLGFLVIYLYQADFFIIPKINSNTVFIGSFLFLFLGSVTQSFSWQAILKSQRINISNIDAIISTGRSVFMKYMPGKVFTILGRASEISIKYNVRLSKTTSASLITQILTLIVGTLFSTVLIFDNKVESVWRLGILTLFVCLTLSLVFFNTGRHLLYFLGKKIGKRILIPKLSISRNPKILIPFIAKWLFWSLGFLMLCISIDKEVSWNAMFVFPVSAVIGIASLLTPGGLGVREGSITLCLVALDVKLELATTIAVFSRLWFLIGECFLFVLSMLLHLNQKKRLK